MADDGKGAGGRAPSPALIGGIVVALAALDFIVQNRDDTTFHFLFFETEKPLWVLLLITSALAIVAAELIAVAIRRARRD